MCIYIYISLCMQWQLHFPAPLDTAVFKKSKKNWCDFHDNFQGTITYPIFSGSKTVPMIFLGRQKLVPSTLGGSKPWWIGWVKSWGISGDFYVLDLYHLHPLRYICSYLQLFAHIYFWSKRFTKKRMKGWGSEAVRVLEYLKCGVAASQVASLSWLWRQACLPWNVGFVRLESWAMCGRVSWWDKFGTNSFCAKVCGSCRS